MAENQEAREDELLALSSIYDQEEFRRNGCAQGGDIRICPDLPRDFKVIVKAGGTCTEYGVSFLPPLVLNFELPMDYPSRSSPLHTLNCKWLSEVQKQTLLDEKIETYSSDYGGCIPQAGAAVCKHLDELWKESLGSVVLFSWIQFLREDVLTFLHISPSLELPSQWESSVTEADEEGTGHGASGGLDDPRTTHRLADSHTDLLLLVLDFDKARRRKLFDSQVFDCGICFSQKLGSNCLSFRECEHVYCAACMREYYKVQISEGAIRGLKCPHSECSSEATPMQVKQLVGDELFGRYDRLLLQSSLDSMADVVYCPRRTCATAVMLEPDNTVAICSACRYAFCTLCRQGYHGLAQCKKKGARESDTHTDMPTSVDMTHAPVPEKDEGLRGLWEDYDTGSEERRKFLEKRYGKQTLQDKVEDCLSQSWFAENTKECPRCSAIIQKIGGCNRMVCFKCHQYFCWACLIILPQNNASNHFGNPDSPCYNY
ncbi:hypothetical protein AAFF_G00006250 [Aldrovandia affinis]|uniref:RBR-type E3 ubiquitin transferase n=1 Tax=Aldrovandia affinis TaxID=143900 RepID=A0AAD7X307_9TELE|nr:hypothetical protein AAFF_G00006250 [Aldrovandia affinis]